MKANGEVFSIVTRRNSRSACVCARLRVSACVFVRRRCVFLRVNDVRRGAITRANEGSVFITGVTSLISFQRKEDEDEEWDELGRVRTKARQDGLNKKT